MGKHNLKNGPNFSNLGGIVSKIVCIMHLNAF